jgi:hypothetical protein
MHEIVKEIDSNKARVLQQAEADLMGSSPNDACQVPKTREEAAKQHEKGGEGNGGSCFPGTGTVWTKEVGPLVLSQLSTGHHVLALDGAGKIVFSKVR